MRRISLVLAVALTMVALMLAVSPAKAQNREDNGDRDNGNRANQSDHRNWNDRNRNDRDWNPRWGSGITFCGWRRDGSVARPEWGFRHGGRDRRIRD